MVTINYEGKAFELRNEPSEISLKEFNKIFTILNTPEKGKLEQYFDVFESLGVPSELLDEIEQADFIELVKQFNAMQVSTEIPINAIMIEGFNYVAYKDEFKFKAKDLIEIEKLAKRGVSNFPSMILAILFKREDLSPKEHYVLAHIEQKAKLFEKHCTADFALPYITLVARRTLKSLENVESNNGSGMVGDSQS
jgi:hypothetical protein